MSSLVFVQFRYSIKKIQIPFIGSCISAKDLKQAIKQKCSLVNSDIELYVKDNQEEKFFSDNDLIPSLTNVIAIRKPLVNSKSVKTNKTINPENFNKTDPYKTINNDGVGNIIKKVNLAECNMTEDEKMDAIVEQAKNNYQCMHKRGPDGVPPPSYTCNKCNIPGHWINYCPGILDKNGKLVDSRNVKRPSGIPVSRLTEVDENTPNSYLTPDGRYVVNTKNREAALKGKKEKRPFSEEENPKLVLETKSNTPDSLICRLCSNLLKDPRKTPCCGSVYCSACINESLFETIELIKMHTCPNCGSKIDKLDSLLEDNFTENLVNQFLKTKLQNEVVEIKDEKEVEKDSETLEISTETDEDLFDDIFIRSNEEENAQLLSEICNDEIMEIDQVLKEDQKEEDPNSCVKFEVIQQLIISGLNVTSQDLMKIDLSTLTAINEFVNSFKLKTEVLTDKTEERIMSIKRNTKQNDKSQQSLKEWKNERKISPLYHRESLKELQNYDDLPSNRREESSPKKRRLFKHENRNRDENLEQRKNYSYKYEQGHREWRNKLEHRNNYEYSQETCKKNYEELPKSSLIDMEHRRRMVPKSHLKRSNNSRESERSPHIYTRDRSRSPVLKYHNSKYDNYDQCNRNSYNRFH